jgi:rhamnose transport system ATP-binding protein
MITSDLPEVLAKSDRILVRHEGRVTEEIARAEATEERVMFAATGQTEQAASAEATGGR